MLRYLLKDLKKNFGTSESDLELSDLNYKVGNTSGMDVTGNIPSAIAERVGNSAQRGGSMMEVLLKNPTSFQIDREPLYNTIQQLGLDITLHSDPNIGYTSPYKTGGGRGFEVTHTYFTNYLTQLASFKKEKEERKDLDFNISRINPHISTSQLPALEERAPQDVGLDPFGYSISDYSDHVNALRDHDEQNIFANSEFLERMYFSFVIDEIGDREYRYFDQFYNNFSTKFDKEWRIKKNEVAQQIYENKTGSETHALEDKIKIISVVANSDSAISTEWLRKLDREIQEVTVQTPTRNSVQSKDLKTLEDLDEWLRTVTGREYRLSRLRNLTETFYFLSESGDLSKISEVDVDEDKQRELWNALKGPLGDIIDELWREGPRDDQENGDDARISLIPVDAKLGALTQRFEIPQNRILDRAFTQNGNKEDLRNHVSKLFAGDPDYFDQDEEGHDKFMEAFMSNFEQAMWMESNLLYKIIPAWMSCSNENYKDDNGNVVHKSFEGPKFIWDTLIERKYDVDFGEGYLTRLEEDEEFRIDIGSAAAAVYVWSHFTQVKTDFETDDKWVRKHFENSAIGLEEVDQEGLTWIEWMNEFGIGVNMETMYGNPQSYLKLWRPKDIVACCRGVNITARNQLGEVNSELYGCPLKFTIDLEHTASFGGDPWKHMEDLIEQEEWVARNMGDIVTADEERPLAEMVRTYHLTKPGWETSQGTGHLHGGFRYGDEQLYTWLHDLVVNGFGQTDEPASVMYEIGGEQVGTVQKAKLSMNMIELGISPEDLDPSKVNPGKKYRDEREALMARFFRMDRPSYNREWAKIEQHAFDPLEGLLEAPEFDYTFSSMAAIKNDKMRQWPNEEYR